MFISIEEEDEEDCYGSSSVVIVVVVAAVVVVGVESGNIVSVLGRAFLRPREPHTFINSCSVFSSNGSLPPPRDERRDLL